LKGRIRQGNCLAFSKKLRMNKKRILHIQLLPLLSGVQNMMLCLLDGLDKEKYDIYVLSKPQGPLEEAVIKAGYHYLPVGCLRRNLSFLDFAAGLEIYRLIKKYHFHIVHTHSSKTGFLGRIAAKFAGVPLIVHTVHGFAIHKYQTPLANQVVMFLEYIAGKFCDRVVFVNDYEREMAIKKRILPPEKVITIYNGIAAEKYKFKEPSSYLADRDCSRNPFTIGSVLRFTAQKNILNTISTAINVCKQNKDIRFVFIGDGEEFQSCRDLIREAGLNTRILLPGWQSEINALLIKMDVFLLFSRWEGLSISILEAMASGLPIVASDIKGNNELVTQTNGILVDANNTAALERILLSLPAQREQLCEWSRNSREKVVQHFSRQDFICKYRTIYES